MKSFTGLILGLLVITGCTAQSANMVPDAVVTQNSFSGSAEVQVSGADGAVAKAEDIQLAVEQAIQQSGLFRSENDERFVVRMDVLAIENPMIGANLTSKVRASWKIRKSGTPDVLWEEQIVSEETAGFGEHLMAARRMAIANEKAIAANIRMAISAMESFALEYETSKESEVVS